MEAGAWRPGGRVRFARRAAAVARGASLGAGLVAGRDAANASADAAADDHTVVGTITAFDWPSGLHAVQRDGAGGGTIHVRLRTAQDLEYTPPQAPALTA